ncbi:E3 ubiquitin-protein ligase SGR9, amyloplastic [Cardamine amara subsp. amara]|uniref:RING-type E3 ubiquitin transferase n=1 Tax=Cardamine amara subsp. amara TaxID=228776 RepID=A0ABD1AWA6_CARAN
MEEENTTIIMTSLSFLPPSHLTNLTHSVISLSHHHRRRLAAVLSSPTLFSLTLRHLLSLTLPDKTHLIATHLLSLLHPLLLHRNHHSLSSSAATMKLRDLDAVVLLLFLCETHQLHPDVLEASPDHWREILGNLCSHSMLNNISGLWTCDAGILMPYIETLVRCKRFVDIMGGYNHLRRGDQKEGYEVPAARAAVVALRAVEVFNAATSNAGEIECVICKEDMTEGRDVCEMPCQHLFHWKCILPWLSKKNTCPFCRFQLPTDDVFSEIQRLWEILVKTSEIHVA